MLLFLHILAWPLCTVFNMEGTFECVLSKPVFQVPPWQTSSLICLPYIVLPILTCSYWDILLQAHHNNGCNGILCHAGFVHLLKRPWKQNTSSLHSYTRVPRLDSTQLGEMMKTDGVVTDPPLFCTAPVIRGTGLCDWQLPATATASKHGSAMWWWCFSPHLNVSLGWYHGVRAPIALPVTSSVMTCLTLCSQKLLLF